MISIKNKNCSEINKELNVILMLTKNIYAPHRANKLCKEKEKVLIKEVHKMRINSFLKLAEENRLDFYLCDHPFFKFHKKELPKELLRRLDLIKKRKESFDWLLAKTYSDLNLALKNKYLALKTYRGFSRWSHDLDILVPSLKSALLLLKRHGWRIENVNQGPYKKLISKKGRIIVSVHERVSWNGVEIIDNKLNWIRVRKRKFSGVDIRLPTKEAEFLIHIGHIPFELLYFRLDDLFYIFKLMKHLNYHLILKQVKKHRWIKTFNHLIKLLNQMHLYLYNCSPEIFKTNEERAKGKICFPFSCPISVVVLAHIEKGCWNKILSTRFLIKDTFLKMINQFKY